MILTMLLAINIGGVTLHSFAGIRLGNAATDKLIKSITKSKKHSARWKQCEVLIVDEVSMIPSDLFEKV